MKLDLAISHRKVLLWMLAFIITVAAGYFQRRTGPSYAITGKSGIADSSVEYRLERSEVVGKEAPVRIEAPDTMITGTIQFRRFKSKDAWKTESLEREGAYLTFGLPSQPAAGKIVYFVYLQKGDDRISLTGEKPAILRYRGDVPGFILLAHVLVIFLAMLLSTRTGLEALDSKGNPRKLMIWTIALFFAGGFILGPIMQKYAFGVYWAGFPLGTDLTDNKTLLAMLMWIWAWIMNSGEKKRRGWIVFASVFMLLVYLIPHSLFGSELDHRSAVNPD